jgi:hypothetical protein
MEVQGTIKLIKETQTVSDKFRKREFVITTEDTYPQHILIELTQDKTELVNNYKVGDKVKASINIRGREYDGGQGVRYFNTIQAWRIEPIESTPSVPTPSTTTNDDMPF